MTLAQMKSVNKVFVLPGGQQYQALNNISFSINQGEFVAIIGPSGSGKSTTMHILGALDSPSSGSYLFKGKDISHYSSDELALIRNQEIGFVFQSFNLLPRTTVYKNVEKPMIYGRVPKAQRKQRVMAALDQVGIKDKAFNLSNHISGGQIQRVAIARAITMNPPLILADEPTGNIDSKTANNIMQYLTTLNKQGTTIVLITHELSMAKYAKRVIKLIDGRISSDQVK